MNIVPDPASEAARMLLQGAGLPVSDLAELDLRHFFFAGPRQAPAGIVGLEIERPHALLRSLAVEPGSRSAGLGSRLVTHAERYARSMGVTSIYLLTTTAEPFFRARGYQRIARSEAPPFIRATREFAGICPETSAFMRKSFLD